MTRFIISLLLLVAPFIGNAQMGGFVNKAKNKANSKATSRIDNKIDKGIDEVLDHIEGKKAPATQTAPASAPVAEEQGGMQLYSKFDFVPGEQIIYSNDFATDALGELPVGWNTNGTGAVVTLQGLKGNWVQLNQNSMYLTDNTQAFGENFTVEFDLVLRKTNLKVPFAPIAFGVLASGTYDPADNYLLKGYASNFATELKMQPYDHGASQLHLHTLKNYNRYLSTDIIKFTSLDQFYNKVIHVSMQVQKERMRIWFNDTKYYDLPRAIVAGTNFNQLYFDVKRYGGEDAEVGYAISNIKIARGIADTRHKLMEEGKFSTTGILFDVNAATIKPESNGVLKEIASVLQKFPELKITILGHTDSDGSDAANLELSKKRAAAVKESLTTSFGIDASRIESDGKGELVPVGDNKTKEGKAQNRRVEFIKR